MLKKIYHWHDALTQKVAVTFALSENSSHHHHLNKQPKHHLHNAKQPHKSLHAWHEEHNKRVTEFHKSHAAKIERGDSGNGLLARWERFIYNKGKAPGKGM